MEKSDYRPKVKKLQESATHVSVSATLNMIRTERPQSEDLWYNPTLDQYWVEPDPLLETYIANGFYQVVPIVTSINERPEVGDWIYDREDESVFVAKKEQDFNSARFLKVLALPEHFSSYHLSCIINGELKVGHEMFIKYDKGGYKSAGHMDSGSSPDPEGIYIDEQGKIVILDIEEDKDEEKSRKDFAEMINENLKKIGIFLNRSEYKSLMRQPGIQQTDGEKALNKADSLEQRVKEIEDYLAENHENPFTEELQKEITRREKLIEKLRLSGNPSDWVMASAQELVLSGLIEANQIVQKSTDPAIPQDIRDEMDADMEESAMGQGEIESCLTHWSNKYIIRRR